MKRSILLMVNLIFVVGVPAFAEVNAERIAASLDQHVLKTNELIYRASAIVIEQSGDAVSPEMREKLFEVIKNNLASSEQGHDLGQYNRKVLEWFESRYFSVTIHLIQKTKDYYINAWLRVHPSDLWYNLAKRPPETYEGAEILDLKQDVGYRIESARKSIGKFERPTIIPIRVVQDTVFPEMIFEWEFFKDKKEKTKSSIKLIPSPSGFTPKPDLVYFDIPMTLKSYQYSVGFEDNDAKPLLRELIATRSDFPASPMEWSGYGQFSSFPLVPKYMEDKNYNQDGSEKSYRHCQLLDVTIGEDARCPKSINDYLRSLNIFGYAYIYITNDGQEHSLPIENLKRQLEAE